MKQVKVSNDAATFIEELRLNEFESYDLAKASVADGMSVIARLLQVGRDVPDIGYEADDLLRLMFSLSEYNRVIDLLASESERSPAKYILKESWFDRGKEAEP